MARKLPGSLLSPSPSLVTGTPSYRHYCHPRLLCGLWGFQLMFSRQLFSLSHLPGPLISTYWLSSQSWLAIESYAFCWRHLPPTPGFNCPCPSLNSLPAHDPPLSTATQVRHGFLSSLAAPWEGRRAAPSFRAGPRHFPPCWGLCPESGIPHRPLLCLLVLPGLTEKGLSLTLTSRRLCSLLRSVNPAHL